MVARAAKRAPAGKALPGRAFLADLWPDRSARNCRVDSGRPVAGALSTSAAQIHLGAGTARGVTLGGQDARLTRQAGSLCYAAKDRAGALARLGRKAASKPISGRNAQM